MVVKVFGGEQAAIISGNPQDIVVTEGLGTTPVGALVMYTRATAAGTASAPAVVSIGAYDGTRTRCAGMSLDTARTDTTRTYSYNSRDTLTMLMGSAGALQSNAFPLGFLDGGLSIQWTTFPTLAFRLWYIFFGGDGAQAYCDDFGSIGPLDTWDSPDLGFPPDCIIFFGSLPFTTGASATTDAHFSLGFSSRLPTIENAGMAFFSDHGQTTVDSHLIVDNYVTMDAEFTASAGGRAKVTAYGPGNVFTLTNESPGKPLNGGSYLALKLPGVRCQAAIFDTPTSTGVFEHEDLAFPMQAFLAGATRLTSVGAVDTTSLAHSFGVGFAAGSTTIAKQATSVREKDIATLSAGTPTETKTLRDSRVHVVTDHAGTVELRSSFDSWGRKGPKLNHTEVDASACKFPALGIGANASFIPRHRPTRVFDKRF